jgi:ABC-2 type transport system permease protein
MSTRKLLTDNALIFRRSVREGLRDPGPAFVLPLLPPLLLTIVFIALFERLAEIPAFGGGQYVEYLAPGAVLLTAILGAGFTSTSLTQDVSGGYMDRLRLLPARPIGFITGRLGFESIRVLPAAAIVLAVALGFRAALETGFAGAVVLVALASLLAAAYSGLFYAVALATGSSDTAVALQPLGLVVGFLSTALVPDEIMPGWAATLARFNPVSVIVDGAREVMLGTLWSDELAAGVGVCLGLIVLTEGATVTLFRARIIRS